MKKLTLLLLLIALRPLGSMPVLAQPRYRGILLISEVGYNSPGDDAQEEWIELVNLGSNPIPLDAIRIGDEESAGGGEGMLRFPEGAKIGAGETAVIAQTAVGFRALFGFAPDYEIVSSDTAVPDMRPSRLWATGDVALGNDGDEVLLLEDGVIIDAVNYGDRQTFFVPSVAAVLPGQSIARDPANCDSDSAADWQTAIRPAPGAVTLSDQCPPPPNPPRQEALPSIGEIQGAGETSPFVNQTVSFRGVMTGSHADTNASGVTFYTLFVQEPHDQSDGDPTTSDAIAVFLGRKQPSTQPGDRLHITGQVIEFFGLTEIDDANLQIGVESSDETLPEPVWLDDPTAFDGEALEGMRVAVEDVRVVGATIAGCGFFVLPVGVERPFIRGDEDKPVSLPLPILHHDETDCATFPNVKLGDRIASVAGPLTYHFDQFKLVTETGAEWAIDAAPLPSPNSLPGRQSGQISIATLNMLNHFDAEDDTGSSAEPKPSLAAIAQKQQKLRTAIADVLGCPDVIGAQEVEKASLLTELAQLLQPDCIFLYEVVHLESPDARGIDLALLVNPRAVTILASALLQTCTAVPTDVVDPSIDCPAGQNPLFSRPPLRVETAIGEERLTFVVNHFKSKRGGEAETAARRQAQARFLNHWAADQLAHDLTTDLVVMGDFNDYEQSAPMRALTARGVLTNALLAVPDEARYSFVFDGVSQLIDGILLSPALVDKVAFVDIRHVNADYPASYAVENDAALLLFRSSDHDLPIVLLDLGEPEPLPHPTMPPGASAVLPQPTAPSQPVPPVSSPVWPAALAFATFALLGLFIGIRRYKQAP